jgi:hypothetical protein
MVTKKTDEYEFTITIQGFEWKVKFVENLAIGETPLSGLTDPDNFTISLHLGMPTTLRRCVFWHEFLHSAVAPINQHDNPMLDGYIEEESAVELGGRAVAELIGQRSLLPGWIFADGRDRKRAK